MDVDTFMKKYNLDKARDEEKDDSLRGQALERADHLEKPRTGTPHDWEDWERLKAERTNSGADADADTDAGIDADSAPSTVHKNTADEKTDDSEAESPSVPEAREGDGGDKRQ